VFLFVLTVPPMLRVFENRVLRRMFGPKRYEVIVECRKLHYEELNPLMPNEYYSGRTAPLTSKVSFYTYIQQI